MSASELLNYAKSWSDLKVKSINASSSISSPNQPGRSYRSGVDSQILTTGVPTVLTMQAGTQWDNGGCNSTGPGIVTIENAGIYYVAYSVLFENNGSTGSRICWIISSNDVQQFGWQSQLGLAAEYTNVSSSALMKFNAGDTLSFAAQQNSGSNVKVGNALGGLNNSLFHIIKIA